LIYGTLDNVIDRTVKIRKRRRFVKAITANELKVKGISSVEAALKEETEAVISVRGKDRYVVMDMEEYNRLRTCELEAALYQAKREIAEGGAIEESVEQHIKRIRKIES
jgi:hypothetical protein